MNRAVTRGWLLSDAPDHRGPGWPVNGAPDDVARLESERLRPMPADERPTTEQLIRELVHVLACAMGVGRRL